MPLIGKEYTGLLELASGGEGVVYRAYHVSLDRYVVLKKQKPTEKKKTKELLEQRSALAGGTSDCFPALYDVFTERNALWTVQEWIRGVSLATLPVHTFPESIRTATMALVAEKLLSCHVAGVFHGDLKPSNILVTCDGACRLIDPGAPGSSPVYRIAAGTMIVTPLYRAPEITGNEKTASAPADIFALGIIFFTIWSGIRIDRTAVESMQLPWPSQSPEWLRRLCEKCLDPNPENRPSIQSIQQRIACEGSFSHAGDYKTLAAIIQTHFRSSMAGLCTRSAKKCSSRNRREAYSLLCEAVEWDPDCADALHALEEFPSLPVNTGYGRRMLYALPILVSIVAAFWFLSQWAGLFSPTAMTMPRVVHDNHPTFLDSQTLSTPRVRARKNPPFEKSAEVNKPAGYVDFVNIPESAELYINNKAIFRTDTGITLPPGKHYWTLRIKNSVLLEEPLTILPFERRVIDLQKRRIHE
ncbi:MAG: protein kinase [Chitinivibrionales bacterium]|nr:protein kinase [Chitinivibrionales bacterium]